MFDVIHDVEKGVSALIDTENLRALGPIAHDAIGGAEALITFAGSLDREVTAMHPTDLEGYWHAFQAAVAGDAGASVPPAPAGDEPLVSEVTAPAGGEDADAARHAAQAAAPTEPVASDGATPTEPPAAPASDAEIAAAEGPTGATTPDGVGDAPVEQPADTDRDPGGVVDPQSA